MNRIRIAILSLILIGLSTCAGTGTVVTKETQATIPKRDPSLPVDGVIDIAGFNALELNYSGIEELKKNGFDSNDFSSAYLQKVQLKIIEPASGADFSFVTSVEVYAESQGLPKVKLASGGNFEKGSTTIGLDIADADLKPYIIANQVKISVVAKGKQPDVEVKVKATLEIGVTPDVLGLICSASPTRGHRN
jgi:hypothetical protein